MGFAIKFYLFYSTPTLPTSALKKKNKQLKTSSGE